MLIVTISFIKNGSIAHRKLPTTPLSIYATTNTATVPTKETISFKAPLFNPAIKAAINSTIIIKSNIVIFGHSFTIYFYIHYKLII